MRIMLKSKIHQALVTETNIDYEGSVTIDTALMEEADLLPYEQVQVLDLSNGARFETYAIPGERGSGVICINGAAARLVAKGDKVIILSYCNVPEQEARNISPKLVYVNSNNEIISRTLTALRGNDAYHH
jgi:aspartate 1-decarboxylase